MKQTLPSNQVNKAARLAIDNLVEPNMYEYALIKESCRIANKDMDNYKKATQSEWDDLSLWKRLTTSRKRFAVDVLSEVYEELFLDKSLCVIFLKYKILGNWNYYLSHAGDFRKRVIIEKEIEHYNNTKQKLTALTKTHGQVTLDEDEIKLIVKWL